jgi:hypothetical protein
LPVTGCSVTVEVEAPGNSPTSLPLSDDGSHLDGSADDGEYARQFTQTFVAGVYHFKFRSVGFNRDGKQVVREALRDKAVLERRVEEPPGTGLPGGERPTDGHRPPHEDCCDEMLNLLRDQKLLLERLLKR